MMLINPYVYAVATAPGPPPGSYSPPTVLTFNLTDGPSYAPPTFLGFNLT